MNETELASWLTQILKDLLDGKPTDVSQEELEREIQLVQDQSQQALYAGLLKLILAQKEASGFISELSQGNLEAEPPRKNRWASPYKQLHSNLTHLVWQVQRISEGDYNQKIDFLGDFSEYFNKLIAALKEKQKLEEDLVASEEKYRLIAENVTDVIWILNVTREKFTYYSPSIFALRGFTAEEAMEQSVYDGFLPASSPSVVDLFLARVKKFKENPGGEHVYTDQLQRPHKNGMLIWIEIATKFRFNSAGEVEILGVSRNIETRKRMEAEILRQNKQLAELNATKDKFFNIIAHDLKNPFNTIIGFSDLLMNRIKTFDENKVESIIKSIHTSSKNAFKLLENLLEWSKTQTGNIQFNPEDFVLESLVIEVIGYSENIAKNKNVTIDYNIGDSLIVRADRNMISTVLRNLLSNAIKFSNRNDRIEITAVRNDNEVEISVKDNGTGIHESTMEKLFMISEIVSQPGTENEQGTGIGLLLCQEFITQHGGRLWVESELGKGSDFRFTLPQGKK
jgi:PAS domain S-box-containing protein